MDRHGKFAQSALCWSLLLSGGTVLHGSARPSAVAYERPAQSESGDRTIESDPAAEAVFSACRDVWSRATLPRSLRYVVDVSAKTDHEIDERYAGIMTSRDDYRVDRFSARELERPAHPTGTDVFLTLFGRDVVRLNNDQRPTNILGTPQLSPRFSFGLERRLLAETDEASPSSLAVIGTVTATAKSYAVRSLGTEQSAGENIVHLGLRPLREPRVYRLRELWVDGQTDRPIRAVVAGNFTDGPALGVNWSIDFQVVGGVSYIAAESALAPLSFSRTRRYEHVVVSFIDLQPSSDPAPALSTFHGLRSDADLREPD